MKRTHTISIFALFLTLVIGLLAYDLASADRSIQKRSRPVLDTDLEVSPYRGPVDALVVIDVFSDFQ